MVKMSIHALCYLTVKMSTSWGLNVQNTQGNWRISGTVVVWYVLIYESVFSSEKQRREHSHHSAFVHLVKFGLCVLLALPVYGFFV